MVARPFLARHRRETKCDDGQGVDLELAGTGASTQVETCDFLPELPFG
jgi:hypothetical protein